MFESLRGLLGDDPTQLPTFAQLGEMKYLEQVIKESLRLYPSVPIMGRTLLEPLTISGVEIPAGFDVGIPIYALHRNPLLWDEPEKFDPERFSDEVNSKRDVYSFVPFSAGSRNCIGE